MTSSALGYFVSHEPEPHAERTRHLLKAHPEAKDLIGYTPTTFLHVLWISGLQFILAAWIGPQAWWKILSLAFVVGACAHHALFMFFHEATHNLIFRTNQANCWAGILANLPVIFPGAVGFRKFHLMHHKYQGEMDWDADLSGPREAAWVGRSPFRKGLWLFAFVFVEGVIRPARLKHVQFIDRWILLNLFMEVLASTAVVLYLGWGALAYLVLSTLIGVGPHPLGGRWIQEHYVVKPGQETYSYYGPANWLIFNTGYHNEHHDLMSVPWSRLPKIKALAPELYENLYSHKSYTKLLWRFFTDPDMTLFSRVVRPSRPGPKGRKTLVQVDQEKIFREVETSVS